MTTRTTRHLETVDESDDDGTTHRLRLHDLPQAAQAHIWELHDRFAFEEIEAFLHEHYPDALRGRKQVASDTACEYDDASGF